MFLLDKVHPAVLSAVERILSRANITPTATIRDFDGCEHHIRVEWNNTKGPTGNGSSAEDHCASVIITLHHTTPFNELNTYSNFDDVIQTLFSKPLQKFLKLDAYKRSNGSFITEVHVPSSASREERCDAIRVAAQLRVWSFIPVFTRQCELYLVKPEFVKPVVLHYHPREEMILYTQKGSFIVAIALRVDSRDDAIFTRHYLQTFVDAKKLQREVSAAPAFAFEHGKAPESIPSGVPISSANDPDVFWCSFQLFRRQMEPVEHLIETVTQLVNFRSTLFYHIHAGRTYMHSMMRKRMETSLQVLNRAKTKTTGGGKSKWKDPKESIILFIATLMNQTIPVQWAHAVNSIEALETALENLSLFQVECVVGFEVDVRVCVGMPVLRHDPFPSVNENSSTKDFTTLTVWFNTLAASVWCCTEISKSTDNIIGVIKLDFKEPAAAELSHSVILQSAAYKQLERHFKLWWNADVVTTARGGTGPFTSVPRTSVIALINSSLRYGCGLSFGWQLPPDFSTYCTKDMENMRGFLAELAMACTSRPACITFAVKCSAVLDASRIAQREKLWCELDELVRETRRLFFGAESSSDLCFLTFWRGRQECITEDQIAIARQQFPNCTIDVD